MVDGSGTLEAKVLLEFASNVFDTWAEYPGTTNLGRAAGTTRRRLNSADGGADPVWEALARMFPTHREE